MRCLRPAFLHTDYDQFSTSCSRRTDCTVHSEARRPSGSVSDFVLRIYNIRRRASYRTREYQILSINVGTYEHSQNYLRRYQLLHLMEKIVEKKYKPISERTINYFVRVYLKHFAFTERHRYSRWIHGESDSDVDTDGNTTLPRHPRPLHRSEVISVFASQAEWILQDQMSKRSMYRLVDVDIWRDFCERVQRDRKEAARWGVRWGLAKGMEVELSSDDEPCRVVKPKKLGKGKKYTKRKTKARVSLTLTSPIGYF
jgi:hypothetical protein